MSLNGLDSPKIQEAFDTANTEPRGWFLIKYASRDEVELFHSGVGGIVEARNAIAKHDEPSPLYGFLRYRRRNVILKFMPEDCSRLIKARASVHFNAVCERFTPHNTIFELSEAKELKDTKLSAACSLHAASGSNSSSNSSLGRRRLNEIAEESEEEEGRERKRQSLVRQDPETKELPVRPTSSSYSESDEAISPLPSDLAKDLPGQSPVVLDPHHITSPRSATFASTHEPPSFTAASLPTSPATSEFDFDRRLSSQTARPDLYSLSSKPKARLGPRPSHDVSKRPQTAGNFRPIAALPAGFKPFHKGSKKGRTWDATDEVDEEPAEGSSPDKIVTVTLAIPEVNDEGEEHLPPRPATSSGASMKSVAASIAPSVSPSTRDAKMTPEKARLLKAMKMREKKKKQSMLVAEPPAPSASQLQNEPSGAENVAAASSSTNPGPGPTINEQVGTAEISDPTTAATLPVRTRDRDIDRPQGLDVGNPPSSTAGDSAIAIDSPTTPMTINTEARSEHTTDSHPPSPTAASSSEIGDSTKASSLSESTDETVHEAEAPTKPADPSVQVATDDEDVGDGPDELSEIVAEAGLRMSAIEPGDADPPPADELQSDGTQTAVPTPDPQSAVEPEAASLPSTEPADQQQQVDVEAEAPPEPSTEEPPAQPSPAETTVEQPRENAQDGSEVRTTVIDIPDATDDAARSPWGVPTSKFAAEPRSPSTPKSIKSPTTPSLKSKFSLRDLKAPTEPISEPVPAMPSITRPASPPVTVTPAAHSDQPDEPAPSQVSEQPAAEAQQDDEATVIPPRTIRRKGPIDPIRTDLAAKKTPQSETSDPLLDDDALMEELQSATVQEARPVTVSKSPMTPNFAAAGPESQAHSPVVEDDRPPMLRASSNPLRGSFLAPSDASAAPSPRSVSAGGPALNNVPRPPSNAGQPSKKGNMGSSISQRIQALQKLSGGPSGEAAQPRAVAPSSTFYTVRKGTTRQNSKSPSVVDRANSLTRQSPTSEQEQRTGRSRDNTPDTPETTRSRSGSMASRLNMFESQGQTPRGRPESIQVTARILRDHTQNLRSRPESQVGMYELRDSPLTVDMQPDDGQDSRRSSVSQFKDLLKERNNSSSSAVRPTDLAASMRSAGPPSAHQNASHIARRLSNASRRSGSHERDNKAPTPDGAVKDDEANAEKKSENRASRFMRRLSASLGAGRKPTPPQPTSPTADTRPRVEKPAAPPSPDSSAAIVSCVGDVNVQFPDNLLWKRRNMSLDAQGWLILSAVQGAAAKAKEKGMLKRYHLSDFSAIYLPDVEFEELPNSVRLDMVEGSCLQIACEARTGQVSVLQVLQEAHQSHGPGKH